MPILTRRWGTTQESILAPTRLGVIGGVSTLHYGPTSALHSPKRSMLFFAASHPFEPMRTPSHGPCMHFDVATACFLLLPLLRFCAQPLRRSGGHIRLGQPTAHQRAVLLVRRRESRGRGAWVDRA